MPTAATKTRSPSSAKSKTARKSKSAPKAASTKNSASATVKEIASQCNVSYRKARRVARNIGLGVGKGARYDSLDKRQVKKLVKELAS